nr:hypothetical protein [Akkermansiaceae bacterium]
EVDGVGRKEIAIGHGYASGQIAEVHFGIGDRETIERVGVSGFGMEEVVRRNLEKNQVLTIEVP